MCEKANNVDTCMCGGRPECDTNGAAPKCLDANNNSPTAGDLRATCKPGNYFTYIK